MRMGLYRSQVWLPQAVLLEGLGGAAPTSIRLLLSANTYMQSPSTIPVLGSLHVSSSSMVRHPTTRITTRPSV